MVQPKFSVGEVVILNSESHPHCNGEYTVISLKEGTFRSVVTEDKFLGYAYDLGIKVDGQPVLAAEPSLRKKHQPGEMNFTNLMASLNNPVTA
jgi:hypothetical protein